MREFLRMLQFEDSSVTLKRMHHAENDIHQFDVIRMQLQFEQRLFHLGEALRGLRDKALQQQLAINIHLRYP